MSKYRLSIDLNIASNAVLEKLQLAIPRQVSLLDGLQMTGRFDGRCFRIWYQIPGRGAISVFYGEIVESPVGCKVVGTFAMSRIGKAFFGFVLSICGLMGFLCLLQHEWGAATMLTIVCTVFFVIFLLASAHVVDEEIERFLLQLFETESVRRA